MNIKEKAARYLECLEIMNLPPEEWQTEKFQTATIDMRSLESELALQGALKIHSEQTQLDRVAAESEDERDDRIRDRIYDAYDELSEESRVQVARVLTAANGQKMRID